MLILDIFCTDGDKKQSEKSDQVVSCQKEMNELQQNLDFFQMVKETNSLIITKPNANL
jgi:hypothetical protein